MTIDDDHFEYEGGMRQCISGFGENTIGEVLDLANRPLDGAKYASIKWHIRELVRWCRNLNRENQVLRNELLTNGSGWDKASLQELCNGSANQPRHERNTITCPCCGEQTVVDTRCVEDCDECGVAIAYTVRPFNERCN